MKKIFKYNPDSVSFELIQSKTYIKVGAYILGAFIFLFLMGWITGTNKYIINKINHKTEITDTLYIKIEPFSEELLIETLKNCNIKYPYIVLAQAKLESAYFTSKIFRQNHNMFGMRKARQRITSAESEKSTYAYYRDWKDCLYDYAMYQSAVMCNITNADEYYTKLGERYAEDPEYVGKLKSIVNKEGLKKIFED